MKSLRIPDEIRKVPTDCGGVYSFSMRFPSDYELGFSLADISINQIAENIRSKLVELDLAQTGSELVGLVHDPTVARHMARTFSVTMDERETKIRDRLFRSITDEHLSKPELSIVTHALRQAFLLSPPIYVGLAQKQSLRTRLEQHLSGESKFAERVSASNVSWRLLSYQFIPIENLHRELSPKLEKVLQTIFKPKLSVR